MIELIMWSNTSVSKSKSKEYRGKNGKEEGGGEKQTLSQEEKEEEKVLKKGKRRK